MALLEVQEVTVRFGGIGAELHAVALAMQKATVPPQGVPAALVAHRRKYHGLLRDRP